MKKKQVIGRTDKADFPALNFQEIEIKIDTGAYTSSIHCENIKEDHNELQATFLDQDHPQYHGKVMRFKDYKITTVKSSNGSTEERYEVQSTIILFSKTYKISLTLTSRLDMKYPVLIGRKFLAKKFIIDPDLQDISFLQQPQ